MHLLTHMTDHCDVRQEVQLSTASQLNSSWDPSVTFYARSSWLSVSATVAKSDEAAFETTSRSITSSVVGRGNPVVDRRVVELSSSGLCRHPLDVRLWTAGSSICPRRFAAVSRCHLVTPSGAPLRYVNFCLIFVICLSPRHFADPLCCLF